MSRESLINAALIALLLGFPAYAYLTDQPFLITLATRAVILGMAGVGLNLALGQGGLVSLGHAVFFGIGGYTMGILASHAQSYTPLFSAPVVINGTTLMPIIWLVALVLSGGAAWVIGALSLRTSGVYFIMITLAFGQMFYYFSISWPAYGGEDGLSIYLRNSFPGVNTLDPIQFYGLALTLLFAALFVSARIAVSGFGLALNAARQSPVRAQAVGFAPRRLFVVAFVVSGMITGLSGALFADLNRFVSPTMFSWHLSGEIMVFVILGGVGRLFGPVLGAIVYIVLEHVLGGVSDYWQVFLGLLLLLMVLFARGGIMGALAGRAVAHD